MILPFPPSTNGLYATSWKTKRRFKSKAYSKWSKLAEVALQSQAKPKLIDYPIKLEIALAKPLNKDGTPTKRRMDISNRVKSLEDFLVNQNILVDDELVHELLVYWDKSGEFEGVRVKIEPIPPQG
ncbi:RusA family crossover junction endodeoxyribonuclease [bacterium]|nr:RusA family crossover junction endodeoxyribonuclease [bacterium]